MTENSPHTATSSSLFGEVDPSIHLIMEKINPIIHMMERHMQVQERLSERLIEQQERIIGLIQQTAPKKQDNDSLPGTELGRVYPTSKTRLSEEMRTRRLKLYRAALNGDWETAKCIYNSHKDDIQAKISIGGDTALHIAAAANCTDFAKELIKIMNEKHLARTNNVGKTALFLAAVSGNMELAQEIMKKNKGTAMIGDCYKTLPIHMAAASGHKRMVSYLYQQTKDSLNEEQRKKFLFTCVKTDLYDVALKLLKDQPDGPDLAIACDENNKTALHAIARKNLAFSKVDNRKQQGVFKRYFNLVSGRPDAENEKPKAALKLVKYIWQKIILLSDLEISHLIATPGKLIFDAAERGNAEFLSVLICEYPDLIWKVDGPKNRYSIFHIAVKNREADVFNLINEIGLNKEKIITHQQDEEGNNILHLAGILAPSHRLNIAPGAALQMQQELLWFKEVEKVVQPRLAEARNKKGLTPGALFTEQHEKLREKGEKWMKDTATSCMLVATLIATVVFSATFTVPGGIKKDTEWHYKVSLKIFFISNAISLVSSSASIVTFLSILSSPYAEEEFSWSLPRKLLIGLVALFISIVAMMAELSATFYIFYNDRRFSIAVLITAFASTPVFMFILQHYRLFSGILLSSTVFQPGKISLFRKEGETSDQQRGMVKIWDAHLKISCACSTNV